MKTIKKILSLCVVAALVLSLSPVVFAASGTTFSDVAVDSTYAEAIESLAKAGIINGVGGGKFAPELSVTRSMAVTVLGRMAGVAQKDTDTFSDVVNGSWYSGYVGWANENGIVLGVGEGRFMPNQAVTGEDMELMLTRYADLAGIAYTASNTSTAALTRGELAKMLYDFCELAAAGTDTVRETAYGSVKGFIEDNGALVWRGIPYGQADRWSTPTAPNPWTGVKDCTEFGNIAIQNKMDYTTYQTALAGSSDCLNLDIYAPEDAENLPVMVFLHGGNNQTGDTTEMYGQDIAITNDCVFVTLNFRLNLLGFNPLPALKTGENELLDSGNYALLDIACALDWVKANIGNFGGDPDNVTISGFSAGGRDVMALLISPLFEGKFHKAIAFSGGMTVADEEMSAVQIANYMAPLAVEDGKADDEAAAVEYLLTDSEEVAEYLRSISDDRLASLIGDATIHMALFPHLFADGTVLPKEGFGTTKYNSVPVLMLTGSEEFIYFKYFGFLLPIPGSELSALDEDIQASAFAFADKYGSDMYRIFNGQESANTMYANYKAPIYICQIDYNEGGNAGHGVFKSFMDSKTGGMVDASTDGGQAVCALYNAYLTNFLHNGDGNPNGDNTETEWTPWDPKTQLSMVFDGDAATGTAKMKDVSKTYEDIFAEMEADTTISEELKVKVINTVLNGRWFSTALDEHFGTPSLWIADQE